jgi:RNA polymerase sigma factor (sigma-70 family)
VLSLASWKEAQAKLLAGNGEGFVELFSLIRKFRVASLQKADAEDIIMEAMAMLVRLFVDEKGRELLSQIKELSAYCRTLVKNVALRARRDAKPLQLDPGLLEDARRDADPDRLLEVADDRGMLERALASLPAEHARFLRLRYIEGLTPKQIQARLREVDGRHLEITAVYDKLKVARAALKAVIDGWRDERA